MSLLDVCVRIALIMIVISLGLVFSRLVRGPTLADKVVALDMVSTIAVAAIAAVSLLTREPLLLRAALVIALLGFLGTVAFAQYIARSPR